MTDGQNERIDGPDAAAPNRGWLLAAGGTIGALLASSCCVVPLLLVTLGVSGAWIGNLTALAPYKPYFLAAAVLLLGAAFRQVYFRPKIACGAGPNWARPLSARTTKAALWLATALTLLAATVNLWAPLFY